MSQSTTAEVSTISDPFTEFEFVFRGPDRFHHGFVVHACRGQGCLVKRAAVEFALDGRLRSHCRGRVTTGFSAV